MREGDGVVSIFDEDGCGAAVFGTTNKMTIADVSEISWQDTIDQGSAVTERNFGGKKCYTDQGTPEITSIAVNLTTCGMVPGLDGALMASAVKTSGGGVITGFGRLNLDNTHNVAVEVLIQLDADSCELGGSDAPVLGVFFPRVKNWAPNGTNTLNGSNLLKPQYTGKAFQNSSIDVSGIADLAKWDGIYISDPDPAVSEWYTVNLFTNIATLPHASCDPQGYSATS